MLSLSYKRRATWPVRVGGVTIGGDAPVVVQSMTSTSTMDTPGSVAQTRRIVEAGGEIVRLTAQGVREAENLAEIRAALRAEGCDVPLVADIHFNPKAALSAASRVEKVRINPGNFVDPGRVFKKIDYTDAEYAEEILKIEEGLLPLLEICKANSTALRIGVNHGSLSDRIMSRYGDTPEGMVESALEFLRVCLKHDFRNITISIKASNVVVMTRTVRLLVEAMDREDMHFPLHLGVTEAGDGEDGRIKSAVGIGSLLVDGIGDTIRVSLSEEPECEIPVARAILRHVERRTGAEYAKRFSFKRIDAARAAFPVVGLDMTAEELAGLAEAEYGDEGRILAVADYSDMTPEEAVIAASVDLGAMLLADKVHGLAVVCPALSQDQLNSLALSILQAARKRISKTEYIACPGCGRTLYDLQSTLRDIREATAHLTWLKIGVMGCIVNGPGEMADADYGYVGASAGKVSLYKGKECIVKNVPQDEALPRLIELIKENGDWKDPE